MHLVTCTTESLVSELKVSAPTERTVLSEVLSQVTCNQVRDHLRVKMELAYNDCVIQSESW